ncbi:MAG: tyrosine-type recombinase/integrase [Geminicoccaceae bacterium]
MSAVRLHFGAVHPSIVSSVLVRSFISKRTSEGVARSTIDRQLRAFRACLSWGIKNGWKFDIPYIETPGGSPPRQRWLTHDEADRLIACCEEPHVRLFVLVALHSGARTCAILDLTWDRVDLDRNLLLYPPHRPGSRKRTTVVPINQTLVSALEEARECALTDWVIEYRGRPIQSVKTGFRAAVRRAGLDHCTPHDLRRTCATWLVQAGLPLSKVARYLGDSEEMIEKVYGQHSPDFLRDAARSLER